MAQTIRKNGSPSDADRFFENKRCLITGAASGIGKAVAAAVADHGGELFLTDVNADGLDATVAEIRASGGRVSYAEALDIADYEAVRTFADNIHAASGSLDVVMNIAGISIWGTIDKLQHEHWRKTIDINLMGPIHVMECFIPPMIEAGSSGNLVNVSSAAGLFGLPWHAAYSASKFGLRGASEVLRYDLEPYGINVHLACPGGVDSGLVNTIEIIGVDPANPAIQKLKQRFRRTAASPERAAAAILDGVRRNRYMIFTSNDVRMGHWFQRKFSPSYEVVMRKLNNQLRRVAGDRE